ncbi:MAG TPA: class I SAM-dependent methyltransferase [Actinocrinis sp.]|nr:class I SAM-dependent methyltransferase [Actinocrinis sp.]
MPTIPSPPPPPESPPHTRGGSHQARHIAESFGTDAERYDRTRPRYPDALIQRIAATPTPPTKTPATRILDVGCGTGIAARQLQAAGCQVLGVDPDPRMADLARSFGLDVEVSKFEDWNPANRTFDAVTAAQAWHWIDPLAGAAQAARALRPGGRLAIFWNTFNATPAIADPFTAVYRQVIPDSPIARAGMANADAYATMSATAADGMRQSEAFDESEQWLFNWNQTYTRDEWLEQVPTFGGHNLLPPDTLTSLLTALGDVIDAMGGSFTMHYVALVITATRTDAA